MTRERAKSLRGVKIRRQYFNVCIFFLLCFALGVFQSFTFIPLIEGYFSFSEWRENLASPLALMVLSAPLIFFSILNRFLFGKIVCVLNEEGIHYKYGLIRWDRIVRIEYQIASYSKNPRYHQHACIAVVCKNTTIKIQSAPLYILSAAKKFRPNIKTKIDKTIWLTLITITAAPIIIPLVF